MSKELLEQLEKSIDKLESKFSGVEDLKSDFAALKTSFDEGKTQNETFKTSLESIKTQLKEIQDEQAEAKENSQADKFVNNVSAIIEKELKAQMPKLKEMAAKSGGSPFGIEITVNKAAIDMLTTAFALANGATIPAMYAYQRDIAGPADDVRAIEYVLSLVSRGSTNKSTLAIVDKVATEGTMTVTAQGTLKPLISFSYVLKTVQAKKTAGRIKVSEEALDDIPWLMSQIRYELMYQHRMAMQTQVLTAINTLAPSFVAGSLAASTATPSNYDAIRAAIYAVKIASKGRFIPNVVLVTSADVYAMGATKDSLGQYVLPPFVLPDGSRIEGVRIVEVADGVSLTAGNIIVGDFRKLHLDSYKDFTIRIGQGIVGSSTAANIMSDFECNMYTIIGESRDVIWNFSNDVTAFVKGSLASIKTAIEIPEPVEGE